MGRKRSGGGEAAAAQTNNGPEVLTPLLALSADQKLIATAFGTAVRVWDSRSQTAVRLKCDGKEGLPSLIRALAFSPDGSTLLTASDDKLVRFWSTDSWAVRASVLLPKKCSAATFTPSSEWALLADKFGDVHVAQTAASASEEGSPSGSGNQPCWNLFGHFCSVVTTLDVSPDGRYILSGDRDNKLRLTWMPEKPNSGDGAFEIAAYCLGHTQFVACAAFCGGLVVSGGGDGSMRLWNTSGELLDTAQLGMQEPANAVSPTAEEREGGGEEACGGSSSPGRYEAVTAVAAAHDGTVVAALIEGRSEVQLWAVDAKVGSLSRMQTLQLSTDLLPTSLSFDKAGYLWLAGARTNDTCGPGDMHVLIANANENGSEYSFLSDGCGLYAPDVLTALGGAAGEASIDIDCGGLTVAQLSSTLRKRQFTEEERERRKIGRADKKRKCDHGEAKQ